MSQEHLVAQSTSEKAYRVDDLMIDVMRQRITRDRTEIPLSGLSFELLLVLTREAPRLVSLQTLMDRVWPGVVIGPETVCQRVKLVRDALGDDANSPRYIAGVRGRGYRLIADVAPLSSAPPDEVAEVLSELQRARADGAAAANGGAYARRAAGGDAIYARDGSRGGGEASETHISRTARASGAAGATNVARSSRVASDASGMDVARSLGDGDASSSHAARSSRAADAARDTQVSRTSKAAGAASNTHVARSWRVADAAGDTQVSHTSKAAGAASSTHVARSSGAVGEASGTQFVRSSRAAGDASRTHVAHASGFAGDASGSHVAGDADAAIDVDGAPWEANSRAQSISNVAGRSTYPVVSTRAGKWSWVARLKGWRATAAITAILTLAAATTIALQFFDLPESIGLSPASWKTVTVLAPRTVAVLPFETLSTDPKDQYIALGIAETVLHKLAGVRDLIVISRTSSFAYRNTSEDVREIGRKLNARYVIEGSVQRVHSHLRVTARLIDTSNGGLWSIRVDRDVGDVFAVEDEISQGVARRLQTILEARRNQESRRNALAGTKPPATATTPASR